MLNKEKAGSQITLTAGSIVCRGALAPDPERWRNVYGIFGTVVSFLCEDGFLVSAIDESMPMEARAVKLVHESFCAMRESSLSASAVSVRIDAWSTVPVWTPKRVSVAEAHAEEAGLTALDRVLEGYYKIGSLSGDGVWAKKYRELADRADFPACLAGLGPGTTPAGDDFIAGWLLAEHVGSLDRRTKIPLAVLDKTSPAGRTLLCQCLQGQFPELYLDFAEAFVSGAIDIAEEAATAVTRHGATSGFDMLFGFYTRLVGNGGSKI